MEGNGEETASKEHSHSCQGSRVPEEELVGHDEVAWAILQHSAHHEIELSQICVLDTMK
jgi:hypothetical protein